MITVQRLFALEDWLHSNNFLQQLGAQTDRCLTSPVIGGLYTQVEIADQYTSKPVPICIDGQCYPCPGFQEAYVPYAHSLNPCPHLDMASYGLTAIVVHFFFNVLIVL
eukprot:TRINITY_DN24276_c0_g1_i1.p1 TRINITY_DN24276_c0_g1~~TRINITY_DN24276_c0_g1_i1.p1  ORF type:complete len:108 (-),score=7.11 TRINITY_DN24276_c0_g1_i1:395-718(-)